jgi:hypothetical protein
VRGRSIVLVLLSMNSVSVSEGLGATVGLAARGLAAALVARPADDAALAWMGERAALARAVVFAVDDALEDLERELEARELEPPDADRIRERAVVPLGDRERVTHDPLRA